MWLNPQFSVDLVTFTEEILNRKGVFFALDGTYNTCSREMFRNSGITFLVESYFYKIFASVWSKRISLFCELCFVVSSKPVIIYMFQVINENTKKTWEIFSKLTVKWHRFVVFIYSFEQILHFFLVFLSLTLNRQIFTEKSIW